MQIDRLIASANGGIRTVMTGTSDYASAEILDPGLIDFDGRRRAIERVPVQTQIIRPVIRSGSMTADQVPIFSDARGLGNGARLRALKRSGREAVFVAVDKLPTRRGKDA